MESKKSSNQPSAYRMLVCEFLGSAILAMMFGVLAMYNAGIVHSFGPPDVFLPPWAQAFIIGAGTFFVYLVGTKISKVQLHLNPIISTVVYASKVADCKDQQPTGYIFGTLLGAWLAQIVGSLAGVAIVFAFASHSLSGVAMYLHAISSPITSSQQARAILADILFGTCVLALVAYYANMASRMLPLKDKQPKQLDPGMWAISISGFYFFYMAVFWVYSKSSVDFIRNGWYCVFAEVDSDAGYCSESRFFNFHSGLYVFELIINVVIVLAIFIGAVIVKRVGMINVTVHQTL